MHKKLLLNIVLLAAIVAAGSSLRATDSGVGVVALTNSAPVFQDFDSLGSSTTPSLVLPTGWYLTELPTAMGAGGDGLYAVGPAGVRQVGRTVSACSAAPNGQSDV